MNVTETDVVVAGGSVGGCALAALLGRQGVRVSVLEKSVAADHYKKVCSHFIQAGGGSVLERLGLIDELARAGAVPNGLELWTEAGWYVMEDSVPSRGYSVRRAKLDPMLRELAAGTPNVELRRGVTVRELLRDAAGRPAGLRGRTTSGADIEVRARLVVGADGRGSTVARLAGVPGRVRPHGRFGYMAYYQDLPLPAGDRRAQMWFRDRDVLYAFPNDDGVTIMAAFLHRDGLTAFKRDPEASFLAAFAGLPRMPDFGAAQRISPLIGKIDMPNVRRPAAADGVAFVGDAAQASDPVWGVGIGFALQSAEWLADEAAGPLTAGTDLDPALARYRRTHRRRLAGHHFMTSDFSRGRGLNPVERMLHRAATRDPVTARMMGDMAARAEPVDRILRPRRLARAAVVAAR